MLDYDCPVCGAVAGAPCFASETDSKGAFRVFGGRTTPGEFHGGRVVASGPGGPVRLVPDGPGRFRLEADVQNDRNAEDVR
jgi:hypothetical protein